MQIAVSILAPHHISDLRLLYNEELHLDPTVPSSNDRSMMMKTERLPPILLLFTLSLIFSASSAVSRHDFEKCKEDCRQWPHHDEGMRSRCLQQCEGRQQQQGAGSTNHHKGKQEWQEGGSQQGKNPYIFGEESFKHWVRSEHGSVKMLKKFLSLSPLLLGLSNYRLAILESEPNTFVMPTHVDADSVCFVVNGEGVIAILHEGKRESHALKEGDIITVWAGSIIYVINKSNNQKLTVAKLLKPVANPAGRVEAFYSAGREQAESYYRAFSTEVLEAALNARRDRLESFFQKHKGEVIVKAPEEKIRAIAEHSKEGGPWPFARSKKPFNLFEKRPSHQNNRGQLFEADCNDYEQLKDLNTRVSYANITSGSMEAPFFNTRATKISVVLKGSGYVEIVCPHLSGRKEEEEWRRKKGGEEEQGRREERREEEQWQPGSEEQEQEKSKRYTRVSSQLKAGSVFVSPAGHPTAVVASREQGLHVLCFEVQAENNERVYIAGKNNILREMEAEAKELAFGVPARVADEVLGAQQAEVFVPGPEARREEREWEEGRHGRPYEALLLSAAGF